MIRKIENIGAGIIICLLIITAAIKYEGWELVAGIFIAICLGFALLGIGRFTSN